MSTRPTPNAHRHRQPWTNAEDHDLATCVTYDDLKVFALCWERRFASIEQRRPTHPAMGPIPPAAPIGTGWIPVTLDPDVSPGQGTVPRAGQDDASQSKEVEHEINAI